MIDLERLRAYTLEDLKGFIKFSRRGEVASDHRIDKDAPPFNEDEVIRRCWNSLEIIRAEPCDRYCISQFFRQRRRAAIATDVVPHDWESRVHPRPKNEEEARELKFPVEPDDSSILKSALFYTHSFLQIFLTDAHKVKGGPLQYDDPEEFAAVAPDVFPDTDLYEVTFEDWKQGNEQPFSDTIKQTWGRHWGVRLQINCEDYAKRTGKQFIARYIREEEANAVRAERERLAEDYVNRTVAAYERLYDERTKGRPEEVHTAIRAEYERATTDLDFSDYEKFFQGGTYHHNLGSIYNEAPGGSVNELLAWHEEVIRRNHIDYVDFVPVGLLFNPRTSYPQGDAEALFRFCMKLEKPHQPSHRETVTDPRHILLEHFIARPNGVGMDMQRYNELEREEVVGIRGKAIKVGTIKGYYSEWKNGADWITKELIDHIVNKLQEQGRPVDYTYVRSITIR